MHSSAAQARDHRPSILIVDDDAEMASLLHDALEWEGFRVVAQTRGREAIASMEREAFDLVIVDKEMPDINGLDLLSTLRARFPGLRAIFLTAFGGALVARAARKRGADHYMDKPVRLDALIETVRGLLSGSQ
jgi:two-component system response regulator HydG